MMTEINSSDKPNFAYVNLYKYSGKNSELSQQQRRDYVLKTQKERRHLNVDAQRDLSRYFLDNDNEEEEMEFETNRLPQRTFQFNLMQSEWLTDVPDDLEDNWFIKCCPEGFRVLLVAKKHHTSLYNSKGHRVLKFKTHFPGGGAEISNGVTVLDCVYNKKLKTIFVLDCLFWNTLSLLNSEASFRFFWLKTKFQENPNFALSKNSEYQFALMDFFQAQRSLIQDEMFRSISVGDSDVRYDGVVFYHKEAEYTFGETPLVGWLATYMLPEKLNIDVAPFNMMNKPEDYVCLEQYLEDLVHKKRKKKIKNRENKTMDTN